MLVTVYFLGILLGSAAAALMTCDDVNATAATLGVTHTLCQPQSSYASTPIEDLTSAEKEEIVNYHNEVRRSVAVDATNMLQMEWCGNLANLAKKWASACIDGHDDNLARYLYQKYAVGQNIFKSSVNKNWTDAMKGWANENQKFTYGEAPSGTVGHYTQMIWATSHKIGCSYVQCSNFGDLTHRYVCNYGPAGNDRQLMTTPYKNGTKASACGRSNDNDGLCDCTGTDCYNDGTFDPATCTCTCNNIKTTATGDDCGTLTCNGDFSGNFCKGKDDGGNRTPKDCIWAWKYCPDYCNWCPA